jgi:hypothetical protein
MGLLGARSVGELGPDFLSRLDQHRAH